MAALEWSRGEELVGATGVGGGGGGGREEGAGEGADGGAVTSADETRACAEVARMLLTLAAAVPNDDPRRGGRDVAADLAETLATLERQPMDAATVALAKSAVKDAHAKVAFWKALQDSDSAAVSSLYRLLRLSVEGGGTGLFDSARALADKHRTPDGRARAAAEDMLAWQGASTFGAGFAAGIGGLLALPVTIPAGLAASLILALRLVAAIAISVGLDPTEPDTAAACMACVFGEEVMTAEDDAAETTTADARPPDGQQLGEYAAMRAAIALPRAFTMQALQGTVGRAARLAAARVAATGAARTGARAVVTALPLIGGVVGGAIDSAFTVTAGRRAMARFLPPTNDADPGISAASGQVEQARAAATAWATSVGAESQRVGGLLSGWVASAFDSASKGVDATLDSWAKPADVRK